VAGRVRRSGRGGRLKRERRITRREKKGGRGSKYAEERIAGGKGGWVKDGGFSGGEQWAGGDFLQSQQ